jgi:hypothetical protein
MAEKSNIKIDPKDVNIDPQGKVVITNAEFAKSLKTMLNTKNVPLPNLHADALLDVNFGC